MRPAAGPLLRGAERLLPTYARAPVTIVRGEGARVTDSEGRSYLDFGGGIAVVALGHCHPAPLAAARTQLDRLWHASNLYFTEPQAELAARLSARFGGAQAFFCNSGAEAVEAALKYARKATGKPGVVALEGSFHGRTLGALSATGQPAKREPFAPLLPGVRFVPPNDVAALRAAVDEEVGLILCEPVLGEGGVIPLDRAFLEAARELDALLCVDEVQCGMGRTGTFFAFEQAGIRPDLVTLAKALGNGLPIGALLVADEVAGAFEPGDHGSTFGGNPVSCAAACAVVDAIDEELLANVRARGAQLFAELALLPKVRAVRGLGLLLGVIVDTAASAVVDACRERGLLVLSAGEDVVRLAPPLTVGEDEVEEAARVMADALSTLASA
ncbi:MAG: acetylornithine/succinylornithine family transaminase [Thermoleophilia bacterium]|nr:acetylornithine/succinylornithine family transaminase [Gaiellaceae bacterium]MDW8337901.1 acetylornithine/succinylornithine family transaminase [Thermoleophilia bacterium]